MKDDKGKFISVRKSTLILAAVFAMLLVVATGLTVGFTSVKMTRAERVAPEVHIAANTDAAALSPREMSTVDLVEAVADTVVEITTSEVTTDMFMQQAVQTGAGSGVIISNDGYIITNEHVISGADTITVRLTSGVEYAATLIAADEYADIAVVKIAPTEGLPKATFGNSDALKVGQSVVAIGNPLGSLGGTVTEGIISALNRSVTVGDVTMTLLQTSAAINPGNSGGGLFNSSGELIGIVNAKSSGSGIEGLAFAIPANTALDVAKQLIEKGYVEGRPDAGLNLVLVNDRYTAMMNGLSSLGVYVSSTSKTYDGALQSKDLIYSVNGDLLKSISQFNQIVQEHDVGDTLEIVYYRGNEKGTTTLTLVQYNPANYQ